MWKELELMKEKTTLKNGTYMKNTITRPATPGCKIKVRMFSFESPSEKSTSNGFVTLSFVKGPHSFDGS